MTIQEKIQKLTWWNEIVKLKEILLDLFNLITQLGNSNVDTRPYKSYFASISQSGTSAPTVDRLLENTIGNITFSYQSTGEYLVNSDGLFINNKTTIVLSTGRAVSSSGILGAQYASNNALLLYSFNNLGASTNSIITFATLEIRVYN
jgi:hypothetical protein